MTVSTTPILLCLSGLDPGGGAGLQADIEAAGAQGVHVCGLATCLTVQDSRNVREVHPVPAALLQRQLDCLLNDVRPAAVKLGLLGDATQIPLLRALLSGLEVPAVCDPVLRAGGGADLLDAAASTGLLTELLPHITVLTPNAAEARRLAPQARDLDACARSLLAHGCGAVLITGGDEPGAEVVNSLHRPGAPPRRWPWPRLPGSFHGAGCTLAAALAARLALDDDLEQAVDRAQTYTQQALGRARAVGGGRLIPRRTP